jgi:hypothetical protein
MSMTNEEVAKWTVAARSDRETLTQVQKKIKALQQSKTWRGASELASKMPSGPNHAAEISALLLDHALHLALAVDAGEVHFDNEKHMYRLHALIGAATQLADAGPLAAPAEYFCSTL